MISPIQKEDLSFLVEVRNSCRKMLHNKDEFSLEDTEKWFDEAKPEFYLITQGYERIGYFRTSNRTNESMYIGMDLHEKFRGKGLAKSLYFEFMKMMSDKHEITVFKLEVLSNNRIARNLYVKLGFVEYDSVQYNGDVDNIYMVIK